MTAHEKAAQGVSSTPAASENHYTSIVACDKTYATLQAKFALLGHSLTRSHRANDGRCTFVVERWGQARYFTHSHDLAAFLTQIGGSNA